MRKELQKSAEELKKISQKTGRRKKIVTVLACVVVFCTTYALILPATTLESGEKLICTEESVSGHVHNADCKDADGRIQCVYADYVIHTHDENCKDADGNLICGLDEIKEHTHTDECYEVNAEEVSETDGRAEEEKDEASETDGRTEEEKDKADDNNDETTEKKLICTEPEVIAHIHDENCKDAEGNLICGKIQILKHEHQKECIEKEADTEEKKEKSPIEEIKKDDQTSEEEQTEQGEKEDNTEAESEELKRTEEAKETDKKTPEIKEPETEAPEKEAQVKNQDKQEKDEETTNNISEKNNDKEIKESGQESEQEKEVKKEDANLRKHRMTHEGKDYTVHVTFGEDAELPTDVKLEVEEIKQGSTEYKDYYKQAEEALPEEQGLMFCRFFDVSFISDGKKVEPKASVEVEISYTDSVPQQKGVETNAIHFAEDRIEVLPAEVETNVDGEDTFSFTQDSFSVVGTAVSAINLSEGSYIFYRDGYALGVDDSGRAMGIRVTVDEKGYVYPVDSSMNINKIIWKYETDVYNTLKNAYNQRCLAFRDDIGVITLAGDSYETSVEIRIINNVIRIMGYESFSYLPRYLGINNGTLKVGTVFADGDYFFGAKVAEVDNTEIQPGELEVEDQIKEQGILIPKLNKTTFSGKKLTYTWYRREDGKNTWIKVERKKITGNSYNVEEDGSWLNVSLDGGADKYYKVMLTSVDGAQQVTTIESESYHVPYYEQVQNGDFENPVISTDVNDAEHYQPFLPNGTAGMVWKTTASDGEIEFLSVASEDFKEMSKKWHRVPEAATGKQFVELNANMPGSLYQDVLTVPGSTMYWSLAHRGRGLDINEDYYNTNDSNDTMYVIAMSTVLAEKYDVTSQKAVQDVMENPSKYPGAQVYDSITDDNKYWYYHSGEYEVPDNQYLTRYFFVSGETAYDRLKGGALKGTIGNHLDDIHFSTELPPPEKGKVNLEVNKTIVGLNERETKTLLEKLKFKIDEIYVAGSDFKNFKKNEDGSYTVSYQVQKTIGSNVKKITKSVSEDLSTADAEGYIRTGTTYAIGENGLKNNYRQTQNIEVTIADQGTGIVSFVNTYAPETADISISKINDETTPQALSGAVFSLDVQNDTTWDTVNNTIEIEVDDNGIANINHLLYDKLYRLTETKAPDGYSKLTDHIYFKIQKENGTAKIIPYNENGTQLTKWPDQANVSSAEPLKLTVINNKKAMLPETGGSGTNRTYAVGIMMILTSGMIYGCREKTRWGRRRH